MRRIEPVYHVIGREALMLLGLLVLFAWPAKAALVPPQDPASLVARVEERTRHTVDLTADFTQTYRSGALGREIVERGTVKIKRPGRMLWEYLTPEKKTFLSDGKTFYFYVPSDRQVIVREQAGQRGVAVSLLSGEGSILHDFNVAVESPDGPQPRLRLLPKVADPEVERVYLEVDAEDRITSLEIWDAQGNRSRFQFDKLRENTGLKDTLFRFEVPKGVMVVSG
jgi:outer membrane lipoprotein carrier protein